VSTMPLSNLGLEVLSGNTGIPQRVLLSHADEVIQARNLTAIDLFWLIAAHESLKAQPAPRVVTKTMTEHVKPTESMG